VAVAFDAAVERAEAAGARLVPLRVPDPAEINVISRVILLAEASALMEPYLDRRDDFGADVIALFDQGRLLPATDYVNAQRCAGCTSANGRSFGIAWIAFSPRPRLWSPPGSVNRMLQLRVSRRMSAGFDQAGAGDQRAGCAGHFGPAAGEGIARWITDNRQTVRGVGADLDCVGCEQPALIAGA